jgi:hypothetical protein
VASPKMGVSFFARRHLCEVEVVLGVHSPLLSRPGSGWSVPGRRRFAAADMGGSQALTISAPGRAGSR